MRALLHLFERGGKPILFAWIASQVVIGAWISRAPLTEAVTAVRDVTPLVGTYLRLKLEGKI